jgi:hypothetical protein
MILNDKPNCQVSRILVNPRFMYVKRSENDSHAIRTRTTLKKYSTFVKCNNNNNDNKMLEHKTVYKAVSR